MIPSIGRAAVDDRRVHYILHCSAVQYVFVEESGTEKDAQQSAALRKDRRTDGEGTVRVVFVSRHQKQPVEAHWCILLNKRMYMPQCVPLVKTPSHFFIFAPKELGHKCSKVYSMRSQWP